MLCFIGLLCLLLGFASLFARDLIWEMTRLGNKWEGQASERGEMWEMRTTCGGLGLLAIGIAAIIASFFSPQ